MERIKLEHITLINLAINLWHRQDVKELINKKSLRLIDVEKALPLIINIASKFPLAAHLKNRLIEVIEKIGYQLYIFLSKPYVDSDYKLEAVKWTIDGLINVAGTSRELLLNTKMYNIQQFRLACETFDEKLIREIWSHLADEERQLFNGEADGRHLFSFYWTALINGTNDIFLRAAESFIIGFNRSTTLECNMLHHSVAVNNHAAIHYFHHRLQGRCLCQCAAYQYSVLEFILKTPRDDNFAFILSFLERPIVDKTAQQMIVEKINGPSVEGILDQVLRRVNICGNLHYNIFRCLLFNFRHKWTPQVRDKLHFYALNLLSKGRLEKFEFLPGEQCKKILRTQIMCRVKSRRGLAIFVTIQWNNYTHLLSEFFDWLAGNEQDRHFFQHFLSAVVDGKQYDL